MVAAESPWQISSGAVDLSGRTSDLPGGLRSDHGVDQVRATGRQGLQNDVEVLDESTQDLGHHLLLVSIRTRPDSFRVARTFPGWHLATRRNRGITPLLQKISDPVHNHQVDIFPVPIPFSSVPATVFFALVEIPCSGSDPSGGMRRSVSQPPCRSPVVIMRACAPSRQAECHRRGHQ